MNNTWKILLSSVAVLALILVGCQQGSGPAEPAQENPAVLDRLFVPDGAIITEATLHIYGQTNDVGETVNGHRITADWAEMVVTENNFAEAFDAAVAGSFVTVAGPAWHVMDITALVVGWVNETYPNYGILLEQAAGDTRYHSSEAATERPYLRVDYTLNGVPSFVIIQRGTLGEVADSWISEFVGLENSNFGADPELTTRTFNGLRKRTLIKFNLDVQGGQGCTRTPGYWGTHSSYGPASYDATWALILPSGENSPFFFSGQNYYQVITSPSSGGNAYYILGQAYIAAKLNFLAGASVPPAVQTAFDNATALFNNPTNTPSYIGGLRGGNATRQAFLSNATILDDYNNGLTGPGHCE